MAVDEPTNKAELLRLQREGRERWENLIASVPLERIAEPGVKGERSVKDIVAHIAAWERHATERFHALARGESPKPLPPVGMTWTEYEHAFNARVDEESRKQTWEDVEAEARAAYAEFLATTEALPEEVLFGPERPAWKTVAFNGYLHYLDFVDHIRTWLQRNRPGSV